MVLDLRDAHRAVRAAAAHRLRPLPGPRLLPPAEAGAARGPRRAIPRPRLAGLIARRQRAAGGTNSGITAWGSGPCPRRWRGALRGPRGRAGPPPARRSTWQG